MSFLTLLLQIGVILITARAVGLVFRRYHQPQVVGEMTAGILLGPTFLGWVAPGVSSTLFPPESLGYLGTLSQVGLVLFMFLVGLDFDPEHLRARRRAAVVISQASIAVPFVLGATLAVLLRERLADSGVSVVGFAVFMGAAMSVTAFPVLARILRETNLIGTPLGALVITCAAVDDVTAWAMLAFALAIVRSGAEQTPLWLTLGGTAVYALFMIFVMRRLLKGFERSYRARGLSQDTLGAILVLMLASAWTTEWLGIHALFGAFLLGTVMPKAPDLVRAIKARLEDVAVVLLLPLFFAMTGLRTSIGLLRGAEMWLIGGLILFLAVAGKLGGSALAARAMSLSWREAGAIGILMNTRGLMELVILTVGLEAGVINPTVFSMMVMMAIVTTLMTTPLLQWVYPAKSAVNAMEVENGPDSAGAARRPRDG